MNDLVQQKIVAEAIEHASKTVSVSAVQEMLRGYALMMERGEVPELNGPDALRRAAAVIEGKTL